ncbi:MAG: phosphoribosylanthranilate isomerase [Pseudomonadota bacterium]
MKLDVKICGISTTEALEAAHRGGARYVGFVFYPPSPRAVSVSLAAQLARAVPTGMRTVGLFVEPSDDELEQVVSQVPLDVVQLHGEERPGRVAEVRAQTSVPVMKALRIATADDLAEVDAFAEAADSLLFDARLPKSVTSLPGGNGITFDWSLLTGLEVTKPWMLSGGLTSKNLAEAVTVTGAKAVDASSSVEDRPGHKDPGLIREFLATAAAI